MHTAMLLCCHLLLFMERISAMENMNNEPYIPNQELPAASENITPAAGVPFDIPDIPTAKPLNTSYTVADSVCAWICFLLGFVFTHFVGGYAGGLWGGIFWAAVGVLGAVYVKLKGLSATRFQVIVFGIAELFCLSPIFCANGFVNTLSATFSFLLLFYLAITISGAALFGKHFVMDILSSIAARPFMSFTHSPRAAFGMFKDGKKTKNALYILLGLLLAIPLSVVVFVLLIFSDSAFEDAMDGFFSSLPSFSFSMFWEIVFAIPIGMYLFGALFSTAKPAHQYRDGEPIYRFLPAPIAYTAVTPICVFYLIYIITQLGYFTAAFSGEPPEGYSLSEFARRGFFELCVIAVINLCVIMLMQGLVKRGENDRRPMALRVYTIVISGFTLLLIASAVSKMILYIKKLGMTQLRVYTSWFMAVLAIAFVLIIIWQIRELPFWRVMFAAFAVMMGVLCFGDIDGNIARYNVNAYLSGDISEFDVSAASALSISAVKPITELQKTLDTDCSLSRNISRYLIIVRDELENSDDFAFFSIPRISAQHAIASLKSEETDL